MDPREQFRNLQFQHVAHGFPRRLIAIVVTLATFSLLWLVVPRAGMYWLALALLALLAWMATYGWPQAVTAVHDLLHRLEQI